MVLCWCKKLGLLSTEVGKNGPYNKFRRLLVASGECGSDGNLSSFLVSSPDCRSI